jgi:hypothetical protein
MRRAGRHGLRAALLTAAVTLAAANAEPPKGLPPSLTKPKLQADPIDLKVMESWKKTAKPIDPSLLKFVPPPPDKLDYSPDVTFMRCQHPWGGCIGHSFCHAVDLIKEWEHPYTPDASFPCLWWHNGKVLEGVKPGDPPPDLSTLAFTKGMCSEARYHTAYDRYTPVKSKDGKDTLYWKPEPDADAQAEAKTYHATYGTPIAVQPADGGGVSPTVADVKKLLLRYGPVVAWGNGHCNTIVGYDDAKEQFKVLDNYGDWSFSGGYVYIAYKDLHKEKQGVQYFENVPTPRAGTPYAYSARVRVQHSWRGTLTLSVGVGKEKPLVVWETHGRTKDGQHELSGGLTLDVPLPDYAAKHWPPSAANQWYLKVEDNDRDGWTGTVTEFTLARLHAHPKCHSVGAFHTETYGGKCSVAVPDPATGDKVTHTGDSLPPPNPHPGVATVQVPADPKKELVVAAVAESHEISLDPAGCSSALDHTVTLSGSLTVFSLTKKANVPAADQSVKLYALFENPNVNKPDEWKALATVKTDAKGEFKGGFKLANPAATKAVAAAYAGEKGEVICSTYPMAVGPVIPKKPIVLTQIVPKMPWQKFSELEKPSPRR